MNNKLGRNDLCACGSGKKYKKCCMLTTPTHFEVADLEWQKLRRLEGTLIDKHLMPYVMKRLPKDMIPLALSDFLPEEELPEMLDRELLFSHFFMPWFLFNWIADDNFGKDKFDPAQTIAMNYLNTNAQKLTGEEKSFIETMSRTYYSFYSVLNVELDKSLEVKDILLGTTHIIKERQGTQQLKRGDIVFGRILTFNNQSIFIGMTPFSIPSGYYHDLIKFREWLVEENDNKELTPSALRNDLDIEVLDYYFAIMDAAYNKPLPTLVNTDGDLFQFSKSHFTLALSPEETLQRLLPLTLSKDAEHFLQDATRDKSGTIQSIEFPWLKKGNKQHKSWDSTVLGHITLKKGKLILETNSQKRTQQGIKLLTKYLNEAIQFQQTLIESPEQKMKSLPQSGEKNLQEKDLFEQPELQEQIKAMAQAHWKSWFDEPIPVLDNQTPREAAKSATGREKLEALLLQYESYDVERNSNDPFKADILYIRKELALN